MNQEPLVLFGVPALGIILALVCLMFSLRSGKRQRLIDNLPTSKTTGVFIGLVEVKGTAEAEQPLTTYLTGSRCVYYRWQVDEQWSRIVTETYTDSEGRPQTRTRMESGWTTVTKGGEEISFYVQDDCGVIRVKPGGAKIELQTMMDQTCGLSDPLYYGKGPAGSVANSDHRRRFTEHAIPLHAALYVMGQAHERDDVVAPEIAADKEAAMFLISTRSEKQISGGFRAGFWLLGLLGLAPCVGGFVWREGLTHSDPARNIPLFIAAGTGYLLAWLLGWAWMVNNSMVELRQRVSQSWANVDVQLKRRQDLIPNLVNAVTGMRDYERTVQTEVAALRAQLTATPPGKPGPDPAGCLPLVRAIVEAYPDLKVNESFLRLQEQLVDTEQRIALARAYFNDIATFYNTRLQIIPDRFIAALGGMQPQTLMSAAGFERAPVRVQLAA